MEEIFEAIKKERAAQDAQWGVQNHPNFDQVLLTRVSSCRVERMAEQYEVPSPTRARQLTELAAETNQLTWFHILQEEVSETLQFIQPGANNIKDLKRELIQVAAVSVSCELRDICKRPGPFTLALGKHDPFACLGMALCVVNLEEVFSITATKLERRCSEEAPIFHCCSLPESPERAFGDYTPGRFAWRLMNVRTFKPFPVIGRQQMFEVEIDEKLLEVPT